MKPVENASYLSPPVETLHATQRGEQQFVSFPTTASERGSLSDFPHFLRVFRLGCGSARLCFTCFRRRFHKDPESHKGHAPDPCLLRLSELRCPAEGRSPPAPHHTGSGTLDFRSGLSKIRPTAVLPKTKPCGSKD